MTSRRDFLKLLGIGAAAVPLAPLLPPTQVSGPPEPLAPPQPPRIVGHAQVHDGRLYVDPELTSHYGPGYAWDGEVFTAKQGPWPGIS